MEINLHKTQSSSPPDQTQDFITSFDPKNESHVLWLRTVSYCYQNMDNYMKYNLAGAICNNPLPGRPSVNDPMSFSYIHQVLLSKYAFAALQCEAWLPDEPYRASLD